MRICIIASYETHTPSEMRRLKDVAKDGHQCPGVRGDSSSKRKARDSSERAEGNDIDI